MTRNAERRRLFDATIGKRVPNGDFTARTLWGWIAWALGGQAGYDPTPPTATSEREVALSFTADRDAMFSAWNVLANLADLAGKVRISATATADDALDKGKLENGVLEPLRELGLIDD